MSDDEILTIICRTHPIFPGTKLPQRVIDALRAAGYEIRLVRRPWWRWWKWWAR